MNTAVTVRLKTLSGLRRFFFSFFLMALAGLVAPAMGDTTVQPAPAVSAQSAAETDTLGTIGSFNSLFELVGDLVGATDATSAEEVAKLLEDGSKYSKAFSIFAKILDVVEVGKLIYQCRTSLLAGDEGAFADSVNALTRLAVTKLAGTGGGALGKFLGASLGGAAGAPGGPLALFTGAVSGILGGAVGGWVAEGAAGMAYDAFLKNWVQEQVAKPLFESLHGSGGSSGGSSGKFGGGSGGSSGKIGPPIPPDSVAPGSGGTGSRSSGGSSGSFGGGSGGSSGTIGPPIPPDSVAPGDVGGSGSGGSSGGGNSGGGAGGDEYKRKKKFADWSK